MLTISRHELYKLLMTEKHLPWKERYQRVYLHLNEVFGFPKDNVIEEKMKRTVRRLCGEVRKKWMESHRIEKDFLRYHGDWLDAKIVINIPGTTKTTTKTSGSGRPRRGFEESSYRSKMRMVEEMTATTSTPALTFATERALRAQGRDAEAGLVKEALQSTPTRASKIADAWKKSQSKES
ncbi:uncharacterized protein LOC124162965 [Ischnura elegans]|uniref:uncharacterized protein LOC124162965 n=1 Tax=Ischnura elegans TaxID=197161 RepID=UPI001ED89256|nr:uncharacterized protein LOC124162965 [Ischnura elegans]